MAANPTVTTQLGHADPNATPLNINELIDLFNTLFISTIDSGTYIPYVIQNQQPGVDDRNKAWIELDPQGRPISTKIWFQGASGGAWRRIYNGMLGEIRPFIGDPTDATKWTQPWSTQGTGVIGSIYDGWQLCNGANGAANLNDIFVMVAHMNEATGYAGGQWLTNAEGTFKPTGGVGSVTLNQGNTFRPPSGSFKIDYYHAGSENTNEPGGLLMGRNSVQHIEIIPQDPGNPAPAGIDIINPYVALGFIQFVGYGN